MKGIGSDQPSTPQEKGDAIKLFLLEDHQVVRQGLRLLLEGEPKFHVIGEASSGLGAADTIVELKPDVVILDLLIPGLNGLEVIRQIRQSSPDIKIVVL